jgi:hypothetical protein
VYRGPRLRCQNCGASFSRRSSLKRHQAGRCSARRCAKQTAKALFGRRGGASDRETGIVLARPSLQPIQPSDSGLSIPSAELNPLGFLTGGRGELRGVTFDDPHFGPLNLSHFIGCRNENVLQALVPRIGRSAAYRIVYGIAVGG